MTQILFFISWRHLAWDITEILSLVEMLSHVRCHLNKSVYFFVKKGTVFSLVTTVLK